MAVLGLDSVTEKVAETIIENTPIAATVAMAAEEDATAKEVAADADKGLEQAENATAKKRPEGVSGADWKAIAKREEEITKREQALATLESELDVKLKRMAELEASIKKMLEQADVLKDKKIRHLVDIYSNMKAKEAAKVIEGLDTNLAVKILSGMRGRTAGEILTFVESKKAAKLSQALTELQVPFNAQ